MVGKIKSNKNGFAFPFLLVMTVVTFLIAAASWYVYSQRYDVIDSSGVAGVIKTVEEPQTQDIIAQQEQEILGEFKKYVNTELGLEFEYPADWLEKDISKESKQAGVVADFVSLEQRQKYANQETTIDSDLFVSFWPDINNQYALGGDWPDKRTYTSLNDYLLSPEYGYKKSLRVVNTNGYDVHFVTIGGQGEKFGVMIENSKGIYEFNFASTLDEKSATPEVKKIIRSIKISQS